MKAITMKNLPHRALFEGDDVRCWICTMPSRRPVEPLDTLETDVPTTAADNLALWRVRELNVMDPHEYLDFLVRFTKDLPPSRTPDGPWPEPFEL